MHKKILIVATAAMVAMQANAIIIIPIPNLAFPAPLGAIRDAFEKSNDTKALATVSEDKIFGSRYWVWGHVSGKMTQADANAQAMSKCELSLQNIKAQSVGGQPLYNFGSKKCELYKFQNVTVNLPDPAPVPVAAPAPMPVAVPASSPASEPESAPVQVSEPAPAPAPASASKPRSFAKGSVTTPAHDPGPASATKGSDDIVQKMKSLDTLFKQGLITRDDYERKKKQFLDAM